MAFSLKGPGKNVLRDAYITGGLGVLVLVGLGQNFLGAWALLPTYETILMNWWLPLSVLVGIPIFGVVLNVIHMALHPRMKWYWQVPLLGILTFVFCLVFNQNMIPLLPFYISLPGLLAPSILYIFGILMLGGFVYIARHFEHSRLDKGDLA